MSYNITNVEVLSGSLSIRVADLRRLHREHDGSLPESTFLDDLESKLAKLDEPPVRMSIDTARFRWSGEGSGRAYEGVFLPFVVPCLIGTADIVFTWEGGDSVSGLRITDGEATECKVVKALVAMGEAVP